MYVYCIVAKWSIGGWVVTMVGALSDFPAVHWVVQMDCPEDGNTYIHRVGRTARLVFVNDGLVVEKYLYPHFFQSCLPHIYI